jgi:hypothetical protein
LSQASGCSTKTRGRDILRAMVNDPESSFDGLWQEYSRAFHDWDDLTLAR